MMRDLPLREFEHYEIREQTDINMTLHDGDLNWFLAQVKPNCGHIAQRNLKRQGYQTFLPLQDVTQKRSGKFVTAKRPLFPGYIFVAFDAARGLWRTINATYGITNLVRFGSAPAVVPHHLVSLLMERCGDDGTLLPPELLQPGDRVLLTRGAFANFVAEVEAIDPDRRVWVLMDIMGGQTRVKVSADQLTSA